MLISRLKNFLLIIFSLVFSVAVLFSLFSVSALKLSALEGDKIYYLHSSSSQGLRKEKLALLDLFNVKGESVILDDEVDLESILMQYKAKILFKEKTLDMVSYYCYTKEWSNGLLLNGEKVNLHIVYSKEKTIVGTPIVFDGY